MGGCAFAFLSLMRIGVPSLLSLLRSRSAVPCRRAPILERQKWVILEAAVRLKRAILGLSTVALLSTAAAFGHPQQRAASTAAPENDLPTIRLLRNPDPAPDFTVQDLEGKPLSPVAFRGKVILLTFWATWCGPCRAEVPDLIALQNRYQDKLQVIGLSVDEGPVAQVRRFVEARQINYPVAIVPDDLQEKFGEVHGLPTTFLLDTSGRIVQKHVGLRNPQLYELEIRALLGLPVEARVETFDDNGQIFLRNAGRATEFPGLDLSKLTPQQNKAAIRRLNEESCNCDCDMTLAQCRINDAGCEISLNLARQVLEDAAGKPAQQPVSSKP
jgi:thiol-disulfide isomerase/thioredoxin